MEQLSSCYFCGAALDTSVEAYQIVPASLEPSDEQQQAVSLCPSCRRKLATVVETVLAATGDGGQQAIEDTEPATPETDASLVGDDSSSTDRSGVPVDATAETDSSEASGEWTSPNDEATDTPQSDEADEEDTPSADDEESLSASSEDGPESADRRNGQTVETIERTRSNAPEEGDDDPLSTTTERSDDEAGDSTEDDGDSHTDDAGSSTTVNSGTDADDGPSLTALEYNKVMRLLQNRDFPVDKAEIRTVAVNAYEISEAEFDAIIDAAIDRGLIAEEGGEFVSGE